MTAQEKGLGVVLAVMLAFLGGAIAGDCSSAERYRAEGRRMERHDGACANIRTHIRHASDSLRVLRLTDCLK